jgi:hypothetical protein
MVHWKARGEQWFWFEAQADGTTLLKAAQEVSGPAALLMQVGARKDAERMVQMWLEALKVEAEKLARERAARS